MANRRLESAARLLPVAGAILFLPPIALLFDEPVRLLGVPLTIFYLFGAWLALILVTALMGRFLHEADTDQVPGRSDKGHDPG